MGLPSFFVQKTRALVSFVFHVHLLIMSAYTAKQQEDRENERVMGIHSTLLGLSI